MEEWQRIKEEKTKADLEAEVSICCCYPIPVVIQNVDRVVLF
jgi:hypothetical protein